MIFEVFGLVAFVKGSFFWVFWTAAKREKPRKSTSRPQDPNLQRASLGEIGGKLQLEPRARLRRCLLLLPFFLVVVIFVSHGVFLFFCVVFWDDLVLFGFCFVLFCGITKEIRCVVLLFSMFCLTKKRL